MNFLSILFDKNFNLPSLLVLCPEFFRNSESLESECFYEVFYFYLFWIVKVFLKPK